MEDLTMADLGVLSHALTGYQFSAVYNVLSLGIASMVFTSLFLFVARDRVLPKYRMAVMVSATVTSIAAYHYFRMFDSFNHGYGLNDATNAIATKVTEAGGDALAIQELALGFGGANYNVGYRYIDWFLTVPLLLVELVAVLGLAKAVSSSLLKRLVPAAAAMIALGYPGDAKINIMDIAPSVWGLLSTIPFLYIMYVLWIEMKKSLASQSEKVRGLFQTLRLLLLATWGVYPITFILAMDSTGAPSASEVVAREIGYSIADILAKCLFGLMIFAIARIKSAEESKEHAAAEGH
jgi:bacteriorhodopsin